MIVYVNLLPICELWCWKMNPYKTESFFQGKCWDSMAFILKHHGAYGLGTQRIKMLKMDEHILFGGIPTPLKNMSSSIGMMTFPIYGKMKNVPKHQPVIH